MSGDWVTQLYWPMVVLGAFGLIGSIANKFLVRWDRRHNLETEQSARMLSALNAVMALEQRFEALANRVQVIDNRTAVKK